MGDQTIGKCVLEMIGDLDMLVRVNLTQFKCGWLVSVEDDVRPIGPYKRESSLVVLREITHGLHRFSCNKFLP